MQLSAIIIHNTNTTFELKNILNQYFTEIKILGSASTLDSGVSLLHKTQPHIVFLDVHLSNTETSFDLLNLFPDRKFHVIFITSHSQYGLQAIKYNVFDYIIIPIDYKEVIQSIHRLKKIYYSPNEDTPRTDIVMIPTSKGTHIVPLSDILYCKADGSYSIFKLVNNKRLVLSRSLKHAETILSDHRFKRVHRSFIINTHKVSKFYIQDGGFVKILKEKIPISKFFVQRASQLFSI